MKASDLMIGDWVNLNFDVDYKTGESIYAPVQVTGINKDGTVDVNFTYDKSESMQDGWDLKLIKPILLTSEILEKNGYMHDKLAEQALIAEGATRDTHVLISSDHRILINNARHNINSLNIWFVHVDTEDMCSMANFEITHVHELQHALKLCGIEKEIVL